MKAKEINRRGKGFVIVKTIRTKQKKLQGNKNKGLEKLQQKK